MGAAASLYVLDGERVTSFSPYVAAYPVAGVHHRWFVQAGPQVVHLDVRSPVPEWHGTSSTGVGAELSTGYELRSHILLRVFVMASVGREGVSPWAGLSVGWAL